MVLGLLGLGATLWGAKRSNDAAKANAAAARAESEYNIESAKRDARILVGRVPFIQEQADLAEGRADAALAARELSVFQAGVTRHAIDVAEVNAASSSLLAQRTFDIAARDATRAAFETQVTIGRQNMQAYQEITELRLETAQRVGLQRAQAASRGVAVDIGSAGDVIERTTHFADVREGFIREQLSFEQMAALEANRFELAQIEDDAEQDAYLLRMRAFNQRAAIPGLEVAILGHHLDARRAHLQSLAERAQAAGLDQEVVEIWEQLDDLEDQVKLYKAQGQYAARAARAQGSAALIGGVTQAVQIGVGAYQAGAFDFGGVKF